MSSSTGTTINQKIDSLPPLVADKLPHLPESKEELKEDVKEAGKKSLAGLRSLAAGGFGGVCAVIVGHPFDLVKVRLQTAERGVYTSALDVVRKSIARDGLRRGLYAGVSAPLVGVTPMCMLSFYFLREIADIGQLPCHSGDMMLEKASFDDSRLSTTINSLSHKSLQLVSSPRFQ
jgi:solute carrier family 25 carnitine/acylcarnitine transporter 20/29